MWPILENVLQFQIFTVLITIVSAEGRRMTGNHTGSPHCSKSDCSICAVILRYLLHTLLMNECPLLFVGVSASAIEALYL